VAAKKGGQKELMIFAANCKLMGFRNLHKPGYFRFGVSGLNVHGHRLLDFEPAIRSLRALLANGGADGEFTELVAPIRAKGLDVKIRRDGEITLIQGDQTEIEAKIGEMVEDRKLARLQKNWKESDRIRDELTAMGVVLKDGKDPATGEPTTTWEIAR
jgi:cysteinyl-tRNA synthetase